MVTITLGGGADSEMRDLGALAASIVGDGMERATHVATSGAPAAGGIVLRLDSAAIGRGAESYRLVVSGAGVEITAPRGAGIFYGLQTLRQLIAAAPAPPGGVPVAVSGVVIDDAPRFQWRGLHLDVGRHFFNVTFVKRYIDLMARYKLNRFHWHLTDDQGWRIEIRKYPRLTEVGGCRKETMVGKHFDPYVGDSTRYCGFYTQDEIRDVVAYAAARYVTVVPEIEMPGHSKAALAAYPELACTPGPFEVRTTWGVDEDIDCPSERTFGFLEDVLTEVMSLFPGPFIHVGGDEAPKTRWKASPVAQDVIRREGLKDEDELQSYFIRRIEQFLLQHGKRLIGWDEILEGGLAPEATVMSWRGISGGIAAAREGHDVIMTPGSHMYFDHAQGPERFEPLSIGGFLPMDTVYNYEPVPDSLTPEQATHVLGAQGNVWTEYLATPQAVEFMAYPRALALAEVTWSPRSARDWNSFVARLPLALDALGRLGVNYRAPSVEGLDADRLTLADKVTLVLATLLPDETIHYTTDGTDPTALGPRYDGPVSVPVSPGGTVVTARAFMPDGRQSPPRAATFTRTTYRNPDAVDAGRLAAGLAYQYFEGAVRRAARIDAMTPASSAVVTRVSLRGDEHAERYALRFSGYLRVPADAMYEFALTSDDGSTLTIGDAIVVDNDGAHGALQKSGMIALRKGLHAMTVRYFQGGGGAALSLRYRTGDGAWREVPPAWLLHDGGIR